MSDMQNLKSTVSKFVESCGRDYEFPTGGSNELLTPSEDVLLSTLSSHTISDSEKIRALSEGLDWDACYSVVIFGVRLATLAVRKKRRDLYSLAILALAAGSPKVDWRDVLGAFAIFETCGAHLGVVFQSGLEAVVRFADEPRLRPTMDGYFSRPQEMRTLEVMGFRRTGSDEEVSFTRKGL